VNSSGCNPETTRRRARDREAVEPHMVQPLRSCFVRLSELRAVARSYSRSWPSGMGVQPGGLASIRRGLSSATPPESVRAATRTLEGCRRAPRSSTPGEWITTFQVALSVRIPNFSRTHCGLIQRFPRNPTLHETEIRSFEMKGRQIGCATKQTNHLAYPAPCRRNTSFTASVPASCLGSFTPTRIKASTTPA
jgi:hypothetical protein